ncbi:MAG: hypothetical protein CL559_17210, partial [Alphaproteobacteria bacterium]|nr:hypothetical protein [Alphaproteobacteria bacterium]
KIVSVTLWPHAHSTRSVGDRSRWRGALGVATCSSIRCGTANFGSLGCLANRFRSAASIPPGFPPGRPLGTFRSLPCLLTRSHAGSRGALRGGDGHRLAKCSPVPELLRQCTIGDLPPALLVLVGLVLFLRKRGNEAAALEAIAIDDWQEPSS